MNILELAIKSHIDPEFFSGGELEAFAAAVIEEYKASLVPVAYMYVNTDGECEEIYHASNGYDDDGINDEITPLYALPKETK